MNHSNRFKSSQLPNIASASKSYQHITLLRLLSLSINPVVKFITRPILKAYYKHMARHYIMCATHEEDLSKQHAQNAIYYSKASALAAAQFLSIKP